jgi:serine/threonine protein kinase
VSQRFVRCTHCGLPHGIDESVCPVTGRPLELRRSVPRAFEAGSSAKLAAAKAAQAHDASVPPPAFSHASDSPAPLIGQVFGHKYRATGVLGEGGMGTVYECEHLQLHRRVAVKVLHAAQARKKASVARFQNEAHVAGAIGHPNICEIYDMGETEDGMPFLVMELLQGETLADRIGSEGALPFEDVIEIITQVLSGLVAAHEKGIIHRDIKPENVFLTRRQGLPPLVKLLDFGISKVSGAEDLNLTRTGMVMGTPFYMSPEQARGDRNLDHRVDLYATGVMMYECLTGRRPFTAANYNALLVQILTTSARPIVELRPAVPLGFEAIVNRAMQRDRNKRYANSAEMQREVSALRDASRAPRMASVPPEPLPLLTQRRAGRDEVGAKSVPKQAPAAPPASMPPPKPRELAAVSVGLDEHDLLDSGDLRAREQTPVDLQPPTGDSVSIEIPIVAEEPIAAPPPPSARAPSYVAPSPPSAAPAATSVPSPPPPSQPRPRELPPRPAANALRPSVAPHAPAPRAAIASPPARSVPPPIPKSQPEPKRSAPPMSSRGPSTHREPPRFAGQDAPWLEEEDADPTEIGALLGARASDTPIDADATERIPPERVAAFLAAHRKGGAPASAADASGDVEIGEDEAPTTLFDRSVLGNKLPPKKKSIDPGARSVPRPSPTDRAPPPARTQQPPPRSPSVPRRKDS